MIRNDPNKQSHWTEVAASTWYGGMACGRIIPDTIHIKHNDTYVPWQVDATSLNKHRLL